MFEKDLTIINKKAPPQKDKRSLLGVIKGIQKTSRYERIRK